jgi:hypothetical protein
VASLPVPETANLRVQEADGFLYEYKPINTFHVTRHIQLRSAHLQGDVDKLDVLWPAARYGICPC